VNASAQINAIIEVFERLGIEVRQERLGGSGGSLCRIRGRPVLFVDSDADAATRLDECAKALSQVPEVDGMYLSPELRERLDRAKAERGQASG